jgi:hypothetical protein
MGIQKKIFLILMMVHPEYLFPLYLMVVVGWDAFRRISPDPLKLKVTE